MWTPVAKSWLKGWLFFFWQFGDDYIIALQLLCKVDKVKIVYIFSLPSISIIFFSVETGIRRAADISLITISSETLDIPNTQYQAEIEIPTKIYHIIIKDLAVAGENVTISITNKAVKFETDGDSGRIENIFHRGQGNHNIVTLVSFNMTWYLGWMSSIVRKFNSKSMSNLLLTTLNIKW